jgi:glycosyltransferase involved in cell wall biosynthesis
LYSSRVEKVFKSLSKRYSVTLLGWNREGLSKDLWDKYYEGHIRLLGLKAPFGKPSLIAYFPLFWTWIIMQLFRYRPRVVHACDLDTVIPSYIYKKILGKKLVFDINDRYAMAYINPKHRVLCGIVSKFEESIAKRSDAVILSWDKVIDTFRTRPNRYHIIVNCPELDPGPILEKSRNDSSNNTFTIAYTGNIRKNRGLENMTAAISHIDNTQLIIAGRAVDQELADKIIKHSKVKYKGMLTPGDVLRLVSSADAVFILNDPKIPWNNLSVPTRIFEGMLLRKPIITNMVPELITEFNCGLLADYDDVNQIQAAIIELQNNPKLRTSLGDNGCQGVLKRYNWNVMEKRLLKIYEDLTFQ